MKITLLSEIDYAGSAHKLWEAISRHTDHDIEIYTGKYYNPYKHPSHSTWAKDKVQARIDASDIIHLKGDFLPRDGYLGLRIMHKPVIVTVSGSHFRKRGHGGHGRARPIGPRSRRPGAPRSGVLPFPACARTTRVDPPHLRPACHRTLLP